MSNLAAAKREAEIVLACDYSAAPRRTEPRELRAALSRLLLALDAVGCVPGVICPTCLSLAKAESALREIRDTACDGAEVARRYFAEKGDAE